MESTRSAEAEMIDWSGGSVTPRIVVLGMGNMLLQDEGVGVHVIRELCGSVDATNIDIVDGGTSPDISSLVDSGVDKLIIIDAVKADNKPGSIYRFNPYDVEMESATPASLHEIGVPQGLKMMKLLGRQPKSTVVIGVEPKSIDYGLELSPEVRGKMPEIVRLILREIEGINTDMEVDR